MTIWKEYKITKREKFSDFIRFTLNDWVEYEGGTKDIIDCTDTAYFARWEEGDTIKRQWGNQDER